MTDCGIWLMDSPGGTLVLEATYNGCYVTLRGSHYAMVVGVQGVDVAGHSAGTMKRLLKCPLDLRVQDTPNTEVCKPVPLEERLPCAPSPISQGDCHDLGCCYSSEEEEVASCCYGNTVTTQCTRDGRFSIAASKNVTSPPLHLDSLHLIFKNDSGCDPVMATSTFVLFHFLLTSCGTTRQITGDHVMYENELLAT
ncbi:hypothetical protein STEG23_030230 [Scotinomys teguina]